VITLPGSHHRWVPVQKHPFVLEDAAPASKKIIQILYNLWMFGEIFRIPGIKEARSARAPGYSTPSNIS